MPKPPISPSCLPAAERQARSRLGQAEGFLHGSLVIMTRRCGKPTCRCASDDQARHRSLCLGQTHGGKTTSVHIPAALESQVRQWVDNFQQAIGLIEQLNQQGRERLAKAKGQKSAGGRCPCLFPQGERPENPTPAILARLIRHAEKIFALSTQWAKTRDSRCQPRLSASLFLRCGLRCSPPDCPVSMLWCNCALLPP